MGLERAGWRMAFANDIDEDRHHHSACLPVAEPVIPPNITATIDVPTSDDSSMMEGGKTIETSGGIKFFDFRNSSAAYEVGSGDYLFEAKFALK
jgi:hypothetical protein